MASIPSNYEINVAKKKNPEDKYGIHYCCIEIPETRIENARKKLAEIRKMFGSDFNVTMTYWTCKGYPIEELKEDTL